MTEWEWPPNCGISLEARAEIEAEARQGDLAKALAHGHTAEIDRLGKRIAAQEKRPTGLTKGDVEMLARSFGSVTKTFVRESLQPLVDRIDKLEAKFSEIEGKGVKYRGVWQAAEQYERGDLATFDGSCWHANTSTRTKPGSGKAWTLAVKRGMDAK